jgi:hypothetical protein
MLGRDGQCGSGHALWAVLQSELTMDWSKAVLILKRHRKEAVKPTKPSIHSTQMLKSFMQEAGLAMYGRRGSILDHGGWCVSSPVLWPCVMGCATK